jgi:hypothetical protein
VTTRIGGCGVASGRFFARGIDDGDDAAVPALVLALLVAAAVDGEPGPAGVHLGLVAGGGVVGDDAAAGVDVVTGVDTAPFSLFLRVPLTLRLVDNAPRIEPSAPGVCRFVRCEEFLQGPTLDPTALARVVEELRLFLPGDPVRARVGRLLFTLGDGAVVDRFTTAASWDRRTSGAVLALRTPWHHAGLDVVVADVLSPGELLAARLDVAPFGAGNSDDDGVLAPLRLSLDAGVDIAAPVDAVDRFGEVPRNAVTRPLSSTVLAARYANDGPVWSLSPRVEVGVTTGLSADGSRAALAGSGVNAGVGAGGGVDVRLHTTPVDVRARINGAWGTAGFRRAPFSTLYLVERRRALIGAVPLKDDGVDSDEDGARGHGLLRVPAPGGAFFDARLEASVLDAFAPLLRVHTGPSPGENLVEVGVVVDEGPLRVGLSAQRRGMARVADVVSGDVVTFPITGALEASWQVWGPVSVGARWWRLPRFVPDGGLVIDDDVWVFVAVDGLLAFPGQR